MTLPILITFPETNRREANSMNQAKFDEVDYRLQNTRTMNDYLVRERRGLKAERDAWKGLAEAGETKLKQQARVSWLAIAASVLLAGAFAVKAFVS